MAHTLTVPVAVRSLDVKRLLRWWPVLPALLFVLMAVVGPSLVPFDPERAIGPASAPPDGTYYFGTDRSGMDVFSRTIAATRLNLVIAVSVTLFATIAGSLLGLALGMNEAKGGVLGLIARGGSRTLDLVQSVPVLLIGLVAVAFFGRSPTVMIITIAVLLLPNQARLVRNETLRVRSEAYLDAARLAGASEFTLTRKHVLPNSIGPAINNMSVIFALAIIITAGLGFVGAGVQPPTPEWGTMLSIGSPDVQAGRWWAAFFPAAFLALAVAAVSIANGVFMRQRRR
jgi:peptide/nickel transport system permease protein